MKFFSTFWDISQILKAIIIALGVLICVVFLRQWSIIDRIAQTVNDRVSYRVLYPSNAHRDEVVIVAIDDRSLDALKRSDLGILALDKGAFARVINNLFEQYGASVVGIDVIFSNPSVLGEADELELRDSLEKYQNKVVIATRSDGNPHPLCLYKNAYQWAIDVQDAEQIRYFQSQYLASQAYCDRALTADTIPSFSWKILTLYAKNRPDVSQEIITNRKKFQSQVDQNNHIEYFYNPGSSSGIFWYTSYSFIDILNGERNIDLRDKIVLIGEVWTLIHDKHFTPAVGDARMPWVEIQANIINTLREGKPFHALGYFFQICIVFLFQVICIWSIFRKKLWWNVILWCLLVFGCIILGGILFFYHILFDVFLAIFALLISTVVSYIYRFQISDKGKRQLKKQFSLYLAPELVDKMLQQSDTLSLTGETREMTLFFSDIAGFTWISETLSPEELLVLLNEYFSEMTHIILEHHGTLDKYIGDAIMCFFNAPVKLPNHSYEACMTALKQQARLRELNKKWQAQWYNDIKVRMGIHTGPAMHGNIGSSDTRLSYTAMGDSVNLASRLEGICKYYGVSIIVSQDTYTREKSSFHFRELDMIQVKWRTQAVWIYELIGPKTVSLPQTLQTTLSDYAVALELYRKNNYQAAGKIFVMHPQDPPSKYMALRCKQLLKWKSQVLQGVFEMTSK